MQPDLADLDMLIAKGMRQAAIAVFQVNTAIEELSDLLSPNHSEDDFDEQEAILAAMHYCQGLLHGAHQNLEAALSCWEIDTVNIARVHWYEED